MSFLICLNVVITCLLNPQLPIIDCQDSNTQQGDFTIAINNVLVKTPGVQVCKCTPTVQNKVQSTVKNLVQDPEDGCVTLVTVAQVTWKLRPGSGQTEI